MEQRNERFRKKQGRGGGRGRVEGWKRRVEEPGRGWV